MNVGDRVGALYSTDNKTVGIFGYGTYLGDFRPLDAKSYAAQIINDAMATSHKFELDNGMSVYACECVAWGNELDIHEMVTNYINSGYQTEYISIDDVRDNWENK